MWEVKWLQRTSSFLYCRNRSISSVFSGCSLSFRSDRNLVTAAGSFAIRMSRINAAWLAKPSRVAFCDRQTDGRTVRENVWVTDAGCIAVIVKRTVTMTTALWYYPQKSRWVLVTNCVTVTIIVADHRFWIWHHWGHWVKVDLEEKGNNIWFTRMVSRMTLVQWFLVQRLGVVLHWCTLVVFIGRVHHGSSPWEFTVRIHHGSSLWEFTVRVHCESSLWEFTVRVHCESSLWEFTWEFTVRIRHAS